MVEKEISHGFHPASLAISRDGRTLYVANYENNVVAKIDTKNLKKIGDNIDTHGEHVVSLALSQDERILYVLNTGYKIGHETIVKVDTQSNKLIEDSLKLLIDGQIHFLISADGLFFYIADMFEDEIYKVDVKTGAVGSLKVGRQPVTMALSPDNKKLFVANALSATVTVIDTQTWQIIGDSIPILDGSPHALVVSPDSSTLVVGSREKDSILIIDIQSRKVIDKIITGDISSPRSLAISEDGQILFVANKYGDTITLINMETRQVIGSPIETGGYMPLDICLDKNQDEQINLYVANYEDNTISKMTFKISLES